MSELMNRSNEVARIIVGGGMVRHPHGGICQWLLTWLIGLRRLGHDVYYVEKSGWPYSCYDPSKKTWGDDCVYGVGMLRALLQRFGFDENWCFVDEPGRYYGLSKPRV